MEIQEYINQKINLYNHILIFLEDENETECRSLIDFIEKNKFLNNVEELKETLHIISKISKNHYRHKNFIHNIENILLYFEPKIKTYLSNSDIFQIFKKSPRILLFLFEKKIITPDELIINYMNKQKYCHYLQDILSFSDCSELNEYKEKRKIGENDSYICQLIRNDSIIEFIVHVNRNNISLSSTIERSCYETNSLLIHEDPTLIEYAAFFGSIQIFQYLRYNGVELNPSLWIYSIHSMNPELIHLLEEIKVEFKLIIHYLILH